MASQGLAELPNEATSTVFDSAFHLHCIFLYAALKENEQEIYCNKSILKSCVGLTNCLNLRHETWKRFWNMYLSFSLQLTQTILALLNTIWLKFFVDYSICICICLIHYVLEHHVYLMMHVVLNNRINFVILWSHFSAIFWVRSA